MDLRPLEATRDAWVWRQSRFTVKAVYRLLCGQLPPENVYVTQRCRLIWKRHIPLKIRIFGWLLLRRRLMTRVARQRMFPDSPVSCPLCGRGPEVCSHLFFQCPLALLRIFIMKECKICIQLSLSIHQDSRDEIRQKTTNKLEKNNLLKWDNKCSQ